MKRIVLLAPGVAAPWTEGRKKFVADLLDALNDRGISAQLLNGMPSSSPAMMIVKALRKLRRYCTAPSSVDAVVIFPYGTFRGLRGAINEWFLRRSASLCASAGIPHISIFYSCAGLDLEELGRRYAPGLAVGRQGAGIRPIHLGIRHSEQRWVASSGLRRLLFLCGYQQATERAMRDVLQERGLADLLDAGNAIAERGISLTIAIPFLRDEGMRDRMRREIAARCPNLTVELQGEIAANDLFASHDAFSFPYRNEHAVFVPTSLLEAISFGIPAIAADHLMYRNLSHSASGPRCGLHRIGDPAHLARAVTAMQESYAESIARAGVAAVDVRSEWTIDKAVDELLGALTSNAK